MFERFDDRARRVLVLAQEEARLLRHGFIGTEHLLLGLVHEGEGFGARALESLGISLEAVRTRVEGIVGPAGSHPGGNPPFTPRSKKVLELALREALQLGHTYIGTEHLLLGLVREGEGVAAQVLVDLGAALPRVREEVLRLLADRQPDEDEAAPAGASGLLLDRPTGTGWPDRLGFPTRVLPGPEQRLRAEGIELRVVGLLLYEPGFQVLWRISGVPGPLLGLLGDPSMPPLRQPSRPGPGPPPRPRPDRRFRARDGRPWPFLRVSDGLDTPYVPAGSDFEVAAAGEWAGRSAFLPAVPEDADLLSLEWQDQVLRIRI